MTFSIVADDKIVYNVIDEVKPTKDFCLANVSERMDDYQSCGEVLRRRRDGTTHCKVHGEMH